jgi:hypothetical protein
MVRYAGAVTHPTYLYFPRNRYQLTKSEAIDSCNLGYDQSITRE